MPRHCSWPNTTADRATCQTNARMSPPGYQHACERAQEHGRFPVPSRPSRPNVSFLPYFVGFTAGSGPTPNGVSTAARDPGCSLTRGLDVKLSVMRLPGSLFSPQ